MKTKDKDLILTIDNGTQSLRALIFDLDGNLLEKEQVTFMPYFSQHPGWAEQDPNVFWEALCTACQRLWQHHPAMKARIAGVALTTQRATVVNVDQHGRALRPAIIWLDQRKTSDLKPLSTPLELIFKIPGLKNTVRYFRTEAESVWIDTYQPEIRKKTHKYLLLSGYLTHRLTGEFTDSIGCQVGFIPFDYKHLKWKSSKNWRWNALAVTPEMMPALHMPGQILGEITTAAATQTGIPKGLPLVAAAADKACEIIGSGSLAPDVGFLSYGTTATINVIHKKYCEIIPFVPAFPSAAPGYYNIEAEVYRGYWMVSWFKEEFGHLECRQAEKEGIAAEALFDKLVDDVPPGSMGLILQPYWTPGRKLPGPEAKGAVIGFGDVHTRAHLYRSILEGLAYALRDGKELIEKRTRIPITSLLVSGGGSQSRHAMQVTADVFGLPAARPHLYETSGLGAAIDAACGLGFYDRFDQAVKAMTRVGEVFEPIPENQRIYDALYRDVYQKMYRSLKPLYERIREITGYPA